MLSAFIILSGSSAASWSLSIVNNKHTTGASNILQACIPYISIIRFFFFYTSQMSDFYNNNCVRTYYALHQSSQHASRQADRAHTAHTTTPGCYTARFLQHFSFALPSLVLTLRGSPVSGCKMIHEPGGRNVYEHHMSPQLHVQRAHKNMHRNGNRCSAAGQDVALKRPLSALAPDSKLCPVAALETVWLKADIWASIQEQTCHHIHSL